MLRKKKATNLGQKIYESANCYFYLEFLILYNQCKSLGYEQKERKKKLLLFWVKQISQKKEEKKERKKKSPI